jgi:23S rRNA (guanosine2251-2'-O)-methyltransferase
MASPSEESVFGLHAVLALLKKNPERVFQVLIQKERHDQRVLEIINLAQENNITLQECSRTDLENHVGQVSHQGVIAVCHSVESYQESDIDKLLDPLSEPPFLLILDGVQDPHNLGACLRSANAAGVHLVLAPRDRAVGLTPAARKVACGAAEATPFIQVTNLARTIRLLKSRGIWFYGADGESQQSLFATNLKGAVALVLGAEGKGLRQLTRELCDELISIPMSGTVESLNVSVASAVCLFEVVRQRLG